MCFGHSKDAELCEMGAPRFPPISPNLEFLLASQRAQTVESTLGSTSGFPLLWALWLAYRNSAQTTSKQRSMECNLADPNPHRSDSANLKGRKCTPDQMRALKGMDLR